MRTKEKDRDISRLAPELKINVDTTQQLVFPSIIKHDIDEVSCPRDPFRPNMRKYFTRTFIEINFPRLWVCTYTISRELKKLRLRCKQESANFNSKKFSHPTYVGWEQKYKSPQARALGDKNYCNYVLVGRSSRCISVNCRAHVCIPTTTFVAWSLVSQLQKLFVMAPHTTCNQRPPYVFSATKYCRTIIIVCKKEEMSHE